MASPSRFRLMEVSHTRRKNHARNFRGHSAKRLRRCRESLRREGIFRTYPAARKRTPFRDCCPSASWLDFSAIAPGSNLTESGGAGGIRTHPPAPPSVDNTALYKSGKSILSQTVSQISGDCGAELAEIVAAWPALAASVRLALLTLVRASGSGVGATPVSRDTEVPGVALGGFYGREPTVRDVPPEGVGPPRPGRLPAPSPAQEGAKGGTRG